MTPHRQDESVRPRPFTPRLTATPSFEDQDNDKVPDGTVTSRIFQLQQLADPAPGTPPPPLSVRDRDAEQSGWGRRVEGNVRSLLPASRFDSIHVEHRVPRRVVSSYLRPNSNLSGTHGADAATPLGQRTEPLDNRHTLRRVSTLQPRFPRRAEADTSTGIFYSTASEMEGESPPPTPTARREEARQMFEEHGLSHPSG